MKVFICLSALVVLSSAAPFSVLLPDAMGHNIRYIREDLAAFSFLPPLSEAEIARQVGYLLRNNWTPTIEFEDQEHAYCDTHGWSGLDSSINSLYYDNRYWVMWKLPMYGCLNPEEVLMEVRAAVAAFPDCYIRIAGFDNIKQVQCAGFLVHRPPTGAACRVDNRQV